MVVILPASKRPDESGRGALRKPPRIAATKGSHVNRSTTCWLSAASIFLALFAFAPGAGNAASDPTVVPLSPAIAALLREKNPGGRGGCPESNIFVHGFRYLDTRADETMWFLGAPDYLCDTNSFVSATLDADGIWTVGSVAATTDTGVELLAGVPVLFMHSDGLGYLLTTEWQIEAPGNYMYFSGDGKTWSSVMLPRPESKNPEPACCDAAPIRRLCIDEPDTVLIEYGESREYEPGTWSARTYPSDPTRPSWANVSAMPASAQCDQLWPESYVPRSLVQKTEDGAMFSISHDRIVLIPGQTK